MYRVVVVVGEVVEEGWEVVRGGGVLSVVVDLVAVGVKGGWVGGWVGWG